MKQPLAFVVSPSENFQGESPRVSAPLYLWASPVGESPWFSAAVNFTIWPILRLVLSKLISIPSGFSLAPRWTWRNTSVFTNFQQRARWDAWEPPLLPPSGWRKLVEHVPCESAIRVNVRKKGLLVASIIATREGKPLFYARRRFFGESVMVEHTYLVVDKGARQAGLGLQITANALAVYRRMGFKRIELDAGLTDGGSVWARIGYVPIDRKQWQRAKKVIRRNLQKLPQSILSSSSSAAVAFREQIDIILNSENPVFIRQILRLDADGQVRSEGNLPDDLSKVLLRNSRWRGSIRLDEAESLGRARDYLGDKITGGRVRKPEWW